MRVTSWRDPGMGPADPRHPICAWALCDSQVAERHLVEHLNGGLRIELELCAHHLEVVQSEPYIVTVQVGGGVGTEPFIAVTAVEPAVGSPTIEKEDHGNRNA